MRRGWLLRGLRALSGAALLLAGGRAAAALGGGEASIEADRRALAAVRGAVEAGGAYAAHELVSGSARIREYLSPAGVVFAVTWRGPVPPDLTAALGDYADEVRTAVRAAGHVPGRRSLTIRAGRVTISRWGRMGDLRGRVSVDALVPAGVDVHELP